MPRAQVVIVGGGPAGSVTALLLARAGLDVVLLDRAEFPRAKPCGDCLSAEATRLLERLGLLADVLALAPARLAGWRIRGPRGTGFEASFAATGGDVREALAVPRSELDHALLRAAERAGVQVRTRAHVFDLVRAGSAVAGVRYRDEHGEHALGAALTIGADGLRSRVARRLGALRRPPRLHKLSLSAHLELPRSADGYGEMHVADGLCAGIAPVTASGGLWNLTLVAAAHRFGRAAARDPRAFFADSLQAFPALGVTLSPARLEGVPLLASGPFDAPISRVTWDGAALAGDAAGYYDPFTGQGVYQALAAAVALAPVAAAALAGSGPVTRAALEPYRRAHAALTRGPRRVQRLIEAVLSRPALAARALAALDARPRVARSLLAVTGDLQPAASLLSPRLAPFWVIPHNG